MPNSVSKGYHNGDSRLGFTLGNEHHRDKGDPGAPLAAASRARLLGVLEQSQSTAGCKAAQAAV